MKRWGVVAILALAFFGLADSFYLAQHENTGAPLLCDVPSLSDCNIVAASSYSYVFGLPLADFGIFFYGIVFALAAFELIFSDWRARRALQLLALIGVGVSAFSIYVQFAVIKALCVFCLASAATSLLFATVAAGIEPLRRRRALREETVEGAQFSMPPV